MATTNDSPMDELDFRRDIDPNTMYELVTLLGEGSYGAVYSGRTRNPGRQDEVAIKIIPDADDDLSSLWREIRFLQVLRSPFVVSFIESLLYDNELWLVMELCDGGSLFDLKEAVSNFTEPELQAIMAFSTIGLAHLHSQRSIHRDVKSGNILLTKSGQAKLGDFGISAQLTDTIMKRRTVIGSPYWMAPEVIQEASYDGKADIWSLGITLLELCEGNAPHYNVHPMRAIFIISSRPAPTLKEPDKWSPDMVDFVSRCLVKNCEQRATAGELLKHPWLKRTVKEIGAHGKGLPVLRDLILENWSEIDRIRCSRLNIPVESAASPVLGGDLRLSAPPQYVTPEPGAAPAAGGTAAPGPGSAAHSASVWNDIESVGSDRSFYDDSTLRTVSRNNSFGGGMPATRQQMRNRTLSRSNSRSSTPVSTPGKPGAVRGKLFLNATSANIGAQFGYDPNEDASPKDRMISSMNDVGRAGENKFQSDAKSDFKPQDRPGNGRQGTPQRGDKGADNHDLPGESYYDDGQYGGGRINPAMPQSSMIRSPPTNKTPEAAAAKDPPKGGFMAALKYFQDEPIPAGSAQVPSGGGKLPAAAQAKSESYSNSSSSSAAAAMGGSMVRVDRSAARQASSSSAVAVATTSAEVLKTETEVLNELVQQDEEAQNVAIKREIVKQLSALKQQYHDDTATLTQAYSARRKMLMDALLFYSSPTAGSAGGGGGGGGGTDSRVHSGCRDTAESADDSAPVRKPRATKRDEKG